MTANSTRTGPGHRTAPHPETSGGLAPRESSSDRPFRPWAIVSMREISVKAKDKSFRVYTFVTLLLILAGVVFNAFMSARGESYSVAVTADPGRAVVSSANESGRADGGNVSFASETTDSNKAALDLVRRGEADVALLQETEGTWTVTGKNEVPAELLRILEQSLRAYVLDTNAAAAGTTSEQLLKGSELRTSLLEGDAEKQILATIIGFIFSFLFYTAAIIFGMAIANSVVEEKQNRVVEILATAIPIRHLLYGKVLGNTLMAMVQLALYGGTALLALNLTGTAELAGSVIPSSGWFLVFFLFGFLILASMWAVLGSLASRPEDLNGSSAPVMSLILAALFVGMFAKGQILVLASFIPVVSSVAMPIRMLNSTVEPWEPLVALGLALVTAVALLRLGEKVYRRAVMQGGGALSLRKAIKLEQ